MRERVSGGARRRRGGGECVSELGAGRGWRRLGAVPAGCGGASKPSGPLRAPAARTGVCWGPPRRQRAKYVLQSSELDFGRHGPVEGPVFAGRSPQGMFSLWEGRGWVEGTNHGCRPALKLSSRKSLSGSTR